VGKNRLKASVAGSALLIALSAVSTAANAQAQAPAPTTPPTTADEGSEIVVTGIRSSIQAALQTKRDAVNIVDSINAQDIGKLPDQNVVDTLSRIPGVQITRNRGEGANFTIRGISLNTTLINGRQFIGANSDSSARLDVLSSDIVAAIDVFKSPSADQIEGALGGTVNLRTKRPLDLPSGTIALRAQGQYGDLERKVGFRGSALYSTRFAGDAAGLLLNVAYQKLETQQQRFEVANYTRVNDIDGNGDGVNDLGLIRPARLQLIRVPREVERLTMNAAFQARPTNNLELLFEGTYNRFTAKGRPAHQQILLNSNDVGARADADRTVVSGTFTGVTLRPLVFQEDDKSDVYALGGHAHWTSDALKVDLDLSYGKGKAPFDGGTFTVVFAQRAGRTVNATYDFAGGTTLPTYSLTSNFDINDLSNYQAASISDNSSFTDNSGFSGRLDFNYATLAGPVDSVDFGYRYEDRTFSTARRVSTITLAQMVAIADRDANGVLTPNEIPGITYTGPLGRGVFPGVSGAVPRNFTSGTINAEAVRQQFGYTLPPVSATTVSEVTQKTHALFAKLNLEGALLGMNFRGNVGSRFAWTDRVSRGNIVLGATTQPAAFAKTYFDVLPSATLVFDVKDDVILRLSAARVVATPPLSDLAAGFTISVVGNTGAGGNPLLDPYRADQADASLEWYFAPSSLLSGSVFYKKVNSFTQITITPETIPGFVNPNGTGNVFQVSRPRNAGNGEVYGFEINYQHALTFLPAPLDGLGVQANYTYAKSKTPTIDELTGAVLPLPNLSKHSYSLIGYYEKGPVSARLAYTSRSAYLIAVQGAALGGSRFVDNQNQLDASISFAVTPQLKVTLDGQNLLRRPERRYDGVVSRTNALLLDDRRFFFGASMTF
jgi:iron complex outermembrane recepter protein